MCRFPFRPDGDNMLPGWETNWAGDMPGRKDAGIPNDQPSWFYQKRIEMLLPPGNLPGRRTPTFSRPLAFLPVSDSAEKDLWPELLRLPGQPLVECLH